MAKDDHRTLIMKDYIKAGSWRKAAKLPRYEGIMNATNLRRYAYGDPVVNQEHRRILGLPFIVGVDPCPDCGHAPTVCLCDGRKVVAPDMVRKNAPAGTGRKRPPRIAIRKDDAVSAARSIVANFETEQISQLIVELERMRDESK